MTTQEKFYTNRKEQGLNPCILVIFGATGDLTARKLLPALYQLALEQLLPEKFACIGFARRTKSDDDFRKEMRDALEKYARTTPIDEALWSSFSQKLFYHCSPFDNDDGYDSLQKRLQAMDEQLGTGGNRLFYLAIPPSYFPLIIEKLNVHKLVYPYAEDEKKWSRVIVEKPFGHDLSSALQLQNEITKYLDEKQIYRIDHYLGKETVQNLLVFRFSNSLFEALWNNHYIENVQITVAEEQGIGTRGAFFEEAGILRDIVQNHMMQLLALIAMEPPNHFNAQEIRNEKVKVMDSIRPFPPENPSYYAVRGQYGKGIIEGQTVCGYREENNVAPESMVETFVAMELHIDNWRWAGVPFYLRAGKRLAKRTTEVAITFKPAPTSLFPRLKPVKNNVLYIRIQPDEGISLRMNCKEPGINSVIQPVDMDFRYGSYFGKEPPEAYERLICDCIAGDATLFTSIDEVMASWKLLTPLLNYWLYHKTDVFPNYPSGSWGPISAHELLEKAGHAWHSIKANHE
jgi:glucose-6-phosphate 1-dehydrogenase